MRRKDKQIQDRQVLEELLSGAPVCRIGLAPAAGSRAADPYAGYPFVVPVHFVHSDGRIFVHSARAGKKIDMLRSNPRVCVEIDEYLGLKTAEKACNYGTRFRSLIAFGRARIVQAVEEKRRALQLLMDKYAGRSFDFTAPEIEKVEIIEIRLEEITGKEAG